MRTLKTSLALMLLLTPCLAQGGWVQQNSGTTESLNSVCFPENPLTGYIVGGRWPTPKAVILITTNGGEAWIPQTPNTNLRLNSVHFPVNGLTGYAVGDSGVILKTTDGGENWSVQQSGTRNFLYGVYFPSGDQTGVGVGERGTILKTTNGGNTWVTITTNNPYEFRGVHFPDTLTGYIVGTDYDNDPYCCKSTDGGENWIECYVVSAEGPLYSVQFPENSQTGYVVGVSFSSNSLVLKTEDGGNSFQYHNETGLGLRSVYFPVDNQTGYAAGEYGCIFKTTDSGGNWEYQSSVTTNSLHSVHFPVDNQIGYAVGWNGTILKTTDGGTWVENDRDQGLGVGDYRVTAYPNPFTSQTLIQYQLPSPARVHLTIYNISGQLIKTLANQPESPGLHAQRWDGRDEQGNRVVAGIYFYRLEAGGYTATNKLVLIR